jgi:microcompartment protein CcmK/EutM
MLLARVVGPVWGARHAAGLHGHKVLELVTEHGGRLCAVDALGAGPGEWVLVAHGSRVRNLTIGETVTEKDIIIAIVDGLDCPELGAPAQVALGGGSASMDAARAPAGPPARPGARR